MNLERLVADKRLRELQEICSFWNGELPLPRSREDAIQELLHAISEEASIRARLRLLSKKLVDLLAFFIKSRDYTLALYSLVHNAGSLQLNAYEIEAGLSALAKRGFIYPFEDRSWNHTGGTGYSVPRELGDILKRVLSRSDVDPARAFSLREAVRERGLTKSSSALKRLLTADGRERVSKGEDLVEVLRSADEVLHRLGRLRVRRLEQLCREAALRFGGLASKSLFEKTFEGKLAWPGAHERKALEDALVGRVTSLSLGEYGIRLAEETLLLYGEVSNTLLRHLPPPDHASLDVWKSLGVDLLSDLTTLFYAVKGNRLRVTQTGEVYRSAVKRLVGSLLTNGKGDFEDGEVFRFALQFAIGQKLLRRAPDRSLQLTPKGAEWEALPVERKLRELLQFAVEERGLGGEYFHQVRLRRILVEKLRTLGAAKTLDPLALAHLSRNSYLVRLGAYHVREFFQNRFQYVQDSPLEDPVEMTANLSRWVRKRLFLLGLVELGTTGGKAVAVRLSPLGVRVLGLPAVFEAPHASGRGGNVVVNPDFEVLLFSEEGDPNLAYALDRFCERVKSDRIHHYRITPASVERAIVEGMTAPEILAVLSEHSRADLPQNVIYSIQSWAEKVKAVRFQTCPVIRAESRDVVDRLQGHPAIRGLVEERLSPTALALKPDVDLAVVREALAKLGIVVKGA